MDLNVNFALSNAVLGQKQKAGKTNLLIWLLKTHTKLARTFVFDVTGNYYKHFKTITIAKMKTIKTKGVYRIKWNRLKEHLEEFCKTALIMRNCCVVFDECAKLITNFNISSYPWFQELVLEGANHGVGSFFATQRFQLLNKTILANCDILFVGKTVLKADIDHIRDFFPAKVIPKLPGLKFQFYYLQDGKTGFLSKIPKMK